MGEAELRVVTAEGLGPVALAGFGVVGLRRGVKVPGAVLEG